MGDVGFGDRDPLLDELSRLSGDAVVDVLFAGPVPASSFDSRVVVVSLSDVPHGTSFFTVAQPSSKKHASTTIAALAMRFRKAVRIANLIRSTESFRLVKKPKPARAGFGHAQTVSGFGLSGSSFHSLIARAASSGFMLPSATSAEIAAWATQ